MKHRLAIPGLAGVVTLRTAVASDRAERRDHQEYQKELPEDHHTISPSL